MKIYFMRHGDAGAPSLDPADERNRPLTDAGVAEVKAIAEELRLRGEDPRVIFCSDLTRATQTADIVAGTLGTTKGAYLLDDLGPFYPIGPIVQRLLEDPDSKRVMIVGHHDNMEPFFLRWFLKSLTMDTAEIVKVEIDRDPYGCYPSYDDSCRICWRLCPKDLGLPQNT